MILAMGWLLCMIDVEPPNGDGGSDEYNRICGTVTDQGA